MSAIWATGTNTAETGGAATVLYTGEFVEAPVAFDSPSGQFRLQFQVEGNLVLLSLPDETVLWASGPGGDGGDTLIMQEDGNLVIYDGGIFGTPTWSSETAAEGNENAYLVLQNDGNLVIYTPVGLQPLGVFTIPPDWADGSIETLSWLTSTTESPQAVEQRMGLRISPRQMFEYSYTVFNRRRSHFDLLNMAAAGSPFYLPIWHDKALLTSAIIAGATTLNLDTRYTEFRNCTVAVLLKNEYDYELVEVENFTNSSITLTNGTSRAWPAGSVVYPCKRVRVETQFSGDRHADKALKGRMRFESLETNDLDNGIDPVPPPLPPGTEWTEYDISPITNVWEDIAYNNGRFVAVGSSAGSSKIITSDDGIFWTTQTVPTTTRMISVAYGDGKFVAVGGRSSFTNKVITSSDNGVTWVNRSSPFDGDVDNTFEGVAYGNGVFVAVGHGFAVTPRIMTSPDGVTWTARTGPTSKKWEDVIYASGLFVAVASDGTGSASRVMTSPDGITWTLRTTEARGWRSIAYGNGIFVVVSDGTVPGSGSDVMTSPDGIIWTLHDNIPNMEWFAVTYGDGIFVAVNTDSSLNAVMTSSDGINWTLRAIPSFLQDWFCVGFGNGMFVSLSGDKLITSGDFL